MGKQFEPPGYHVVEQGDYLSKIARWYGVADWELIWNHGNNAQVKQERKNPNIIYPGDRFFIPAPERKKHDKKTNKKHTFVVKRDMQELCICLEDDQDRPRPNLPYTLVIYCWAQFEGKTDGEGKLKHQIPVICNHGALKVDGRWTELFIGILDPVKVIAGVQGRLNNLGFRPGAIDGIMGPRTKEAIKKFQRSKKLEETGELDDQTRALLAEKHGC